MRGAQAALDCPVSGAVWCSRPPQDHKVDMAVPGMGAFDDVASAVASAVRRSPAPPAVPAQPLAQPVACSLPGPGGPSPSVVGTAVHQPFLGVAWSPPWLTQPALDPVPAPQPPSRERSRSLHRQLRAGAPVRRPRTRGAVPDLTDPAARATALNEYYMDVYAESSQVSLGFKWRTILRIFGTWGADPFPPTLDKITLLAATLKAGGYRSAPGYLSLYRSSGARAGHAATPDQAVAYRDAARSCLRGLGAPIKATAMPLSRLHELPGGRAPWTPNGPLSPRNAIVVGSWWLLREVELATARACLVRRSRGDDGVQQLFLTLPASKADQQARGAERGHRCRCPLLSDRHGCPTCALRDQLAFLRRQFPSE